MIGQLKALQHPCYPGRQSQAVERDQAVDGEQVLKEVLYHLLETVGFAVPEFPLPLIQRCRIFQRDFSSLSSAKRVRGEK